MGAKPVANITRSVARSNPTEATLPSTRTAQGPSKITLVPGGGGVRPLLSSTHTVAWSTRTARASRIALWTAIATTITSATRADKTAASLRAPYLIWVAYATTLNAGVVAMN